MDQRFRAAVTFTLQFEGGFSNDPADPGNWTGGRRGAGELRGTRFGISAAAYPGLDIAELTMDDAVAIYERDYWRAPRIDQVADVDSALGERLFDLGVNCGPAGAVRMLQRALHAVCGAEVAAQRAARWRQAVARLLAGKVLRVDGVIGPVTLGVLQACPHRRALLMALKGEAYNHYRGQNPLFLPGWLNRLGA